MQRILFEDGRASGVVLRDGSVIRASKAVISNASAWDTVKLLPKEVVPADYLASIEQMPMNRSFMHLHLGFDATGAKQSVLSINDSVLESLVYSRFETIHNPTRVHIVLRRCVSVLQWGLAVLLTPLPHRSCSH